MVHRTKASIRFFTMRLIISIKGDIEIKTLDVRYLPDAEELDAIINYPKEYTAVFFPEYEMVSTPEIWQSSYMPGCYIKIEMIRSGPIDKMAEKISNYHTHQANELLGFHKTSAISRQRWNSEIQPAPA